MKKTVFTLLLLGIVPFTLQSQFLKGTILKTKPFQDFVAYNPTFGMEKTVGKLFSAELEFMYRNRSWNVSGGEWDLGRFYDAGGFKIVIGSRIYFGKTNRNLDQETQKAPFAWYGAIQLGYNLSTTYNVDRKATVSGIYMYTADIDKNWLELNIGIGRQFYLFKTITLDLNLGPSIYFPHQEKTTITKSEDLSEIGTTKTEDFNFGRIIRPNLILSLGYYFK